jgi:hypothetical protein
VGKAARALAVGCQPLLVPDYAPISNEANGRPLSGKVEG